MSLIDYNRAAYDMKKIHGLWSRIGDIKTEAESLLGKDEAMTARMKHLDSKLDAVINKQNNLVARYNNNQVTDRKFRRAMEKVMTEYYGLVDLKIEGVENSWLKC